MTINQFANFHQAVSRGFVNTRRVTALVTELEAAGETAVSSELRSNVKDSLRLARWADEAMEAGRPATVFFKDLDYIEDEIERLVDAGEEILAG